MSEVRKVIEFYNENNKEMPIWISETGYHTAEKNGISDEKQASNIIRTLIFGYANKKSTVIENKFDPISIERIYLYTFQNEATYNIDGETNFGMVGAFDDTVRKPFTRDVSMYAKATYVAVNMFNYLLNDAKLIETYEQDSINNKPYYWYKFKNDDNSNIMILWNNNEVLEEVILEEVSGDVTVYDMYGNLIKSVNNNGNLILNIGYNPVYVVTK